MGLVAGQRRGSTPPKRDSVGSACLSLITVVVRNLITSGSIGDVILKVYNQMDAGY